MPINDLENATGFQVFNAPVGGPLTPIGGGTFNPNGTTSFTPSSNFASPLSAPQTTLGGALSNAANSIGNAFNSLVGNSNGATSVPTVPAPSAPSSSSAPLSQGGTTNPGQSDTASANVPGSIQNYFMRGIVVVVGFIFLAIGLHMLAPSMVPDVRDVVR